LNETSKRRRVVGAVGVVGACAITVVVTSYEGCAVYGPSLIGSIDGGDGDSPATAIPSCDAAEPPDRPAGGDDGGAPENVPVIAAFNTIDIGVSGGIDAAIPPFGYDLDHTCTCPGPPSCLAPPPPKGTPANPDCDDSRGRDNTDIQLFRDLRGLAATGTTQIDQGLAAGQFGLLLVINGYNGKPDDPQVSVDFYLSDGLSRDADGGIPTPKFDGTDLWTRDLNSLQGGQANGQPLYSTDTAYVTNNVVVANFTQLPIAFGDRTFLGGATMQLFGAIIVGQLQAQPIGDGGTFGFALAGGTIAGRWPTSQILATLATIPTEGGFLCGTDPTPLDTLYYGIFKEVVCAAADIAMVPSEDNSTPTLAPCDSISVGMQFTAVPAQLGPVVASPPVPAGCQDGGVPWSDHCPQ
jgi:hypothetical protein